MKAKSSPAVSVATLGVVFLLSAAAPAAAADFIRGDVNGDGRVSVTDARALGSYLYRGAAVSCLDAADADDSGAVDQRDGEHIMNVVYGFQALPPPYSAPGADPATGSSLGCDSYGGGTVFVDPQAQLTVRNVVATGGSNPYAVIRLAITNSEAIAGYQCLIRDPSGVVANYRIGDSYDGEDRYNSNMGPARDLSGVFPLINRSSIYSYARVVGGNLWVAAGGRTSGSPRLSARTDADLVEFTICLKPGTRAGTYPLILESAEFARWAAAQAIDPALESGTLTVEADLEEGIGCPDRPEPSPDNVEATFALGNGAAAAGGTAQVALNVGANIFVAGFWISIDFDEEVLEALPPTPVYARPDGEPWSFFRMDLNNENRTPGNGGVDEGFVVGFGIFASTGLDQQIPADTETEALRLEFRVRPGAPSGPTEVTFLDGARNSFGDALPNTLFVGGAKVPPEERTSFVFINGRINVLPDGAVFLRGDSNGDGVMDISDPAATLGYLFLGDAALDCLDAADADDSGALDISDAVVALDHLFLSGLPLPEPAAAPGPDPTPDDLSCARSQDSTP